MTEERMICEKSHREINHPEHGEITEIWWCPVEPAPPKDWVPVCYNYSELVKGCAQIPFTDKPECRKCPYHEVKA